MAIASGSQDDAGRREAAPGETPASPLKPPEGGNPGVTPRRVYPRGRAVYVISVAADLAGVHPQTLRIYERKGLLSPERTAGNTRRYSDQDVERLRQIQRLTRDDGVNLAGVRIIMEMQRTLQEMQDQLEMARRRAAEEAEDAPGAGPGSGRPGRPHWGVIARLADVRNIYGPNRAGTGGP